MKTSLSRNISTVKDVLSDMGPFWANENPLKMMENAFYFILKSLFILKIFKLLS